jgi:hypothetical protein
LLKKARVQANVKAMQSEAVASSFLSPEMEKIVKNHYIWVRVSKNHHFLEKFKKPPVLPLTFAKNTDDIF